MSKTYNEILSSMQEKFKELAGFDADDASDIGIRLKVLAGELFSISTNIDWLKTQMFPQTAIGDQLDLHAQQRGLARKSASKSKGTLKFSRPSTITYDINIPAGTICSTDGVDGIRVATTQEAVLKAGELSVSVEAESELGGSDKNIAINTVCVMVTPPAGMGSVTNTTAFTGGNDKEPDDELRKRLLVSYSNISNGINSAFYRDSVLSFEKVQSVSVIQAPRGAGSVDILVAGKGGILSTDVLNEIRDYVKTIKEVGIDVYVKSPSITAVRVEGTIKPKDGYKAADVIESCKVSLQNFFNSLSIGDPVRKIDVYNVLYNTPGVENYSLVYPSYDVEASNKILVIEGTVALTEETAE